MVRRATLMSDFMMPSQGSYYSGNQGNGRKRSREDEGMPPAKRIASTIDSDLARTLRDMSISSLPTLPSTKCIASAVDIDITTTFGDMSISSAQNNPQTMRARPIPTSVVDSNLAGTFQDLSVISNQESLPFMEGLPVHRTPSVRELPLRLAKDSPSGGAKTLTYEDVDVKRELALESDHQPKQEISNEAFETRYEGYYYLSPAYDMLGSYNNYPYVGTKERWRVKQGSEPELDERIKQETSTMTFGLQYHGLALANVMLETYTAARELQQNSVAESERPEPTSLMSLPSELRLEIASFCLASAAGPAGTISVNPRAKVLSDPLGKFHGHDRSEQDHTKWQARRGLLQTCRVLRLEALEVLYNHETFFARMIQCDEHAFSF